MIAGIQNYTDTCDWWGEIEEKDFSPDKADQQVRVGRLMRWKTKAAYLETNYLVVYVGSLSTSYYFMTYLESDIDAAAKSGKAHIFRTSDSEEAYALASWIIEDSYITGIRIEAKAKSSDVPTIKLIHFNSFPLTKGEVETISQGGVVESKPAQAYTLPEKKKVGKELLDGAPRKERSAEFPVQGTIAKDFKIKSGEFTINERFTKKESDDFSVQMTVLNASKESHCVENVKCEYRMCGNKDWKPVKTFKVNDYDVLPAFTCTPMQNVTLYLDIEVEDKTKNGRRWFNRPWVARHQPIRFRVSFETITGETFSKVLEYVFKPPKVDKDDGKKLLFLYVDDCDEWDRTVFAITQSGEGDDYSLSIDGNSFNVDQLREIVYKAVASKVTEQQIYVSGEDDNKPVIKKAWALIDLNCKRVYAIKAMIYANNGSLKPAQVGYAPLTVYGSVKETKENKPATEVAAFPPVQVTQELITSDEGILGSQCVLDWSGSQYKATIVKVDGNMVTFKYDGYGDNYNETVEKTSPKFIKAVWKSAEKKETKTETPTAEVDYAQDDDFDDKFVDLKPVNTPTPAPTSEGGSGGGGGGGGVLTFDASSLKVLQEISHNMERMADAMTVLNSMESHLERIAGSFELLLDVLSRQKK